LTALIYSRSREAATIAAIPIPKVAVMAGRFKHEHDP